ncbi:hypothetical protein Poly51_46630 [Rubripirellula tenax]|uniref:Uncharacterized protein n=1 Tax=Rubripirellula tenax TaxID=2528015 RepID=A0A5C6EJS3_9BACT|nr:hypothetical protein Poly51_46630 [Rubripirellula tenax]
MLSYHVMPYPPDWTIRATATHYHPLGLADNQARIATTSIARPPIRFGKRNVC